MKRIYQVVLWLGECKLVACIEDHDGHQRAIEQTWQAKEHSNTPPDGWMVGIEAEVQFQRTAEANKAMGRILF